MKYSLKEVSYKVRILFNRMLYKYQIYRKLNFFFGINKFITVQKSSQNQMLPKLYFCNIVIFENYLFSFRIISQSRTSHNFTTYSTQFLRNVFTQFSQSFLFSQPFLFPTHWLHNQRMRQVKVLLLLPLLSSCYCGWKTNENIFQKFNYLQANPWT